MPRWEVNENGKIPTGHGPGPEGLPVSMTDQLMICLEDVSAEYSSGGIVVIPACPSDMGFWGYTSVPEEMCNWWTDLPTR